MSVPGEEFWSRLSANPFHRVGDAKLCEGAFHPHTCLIKFLATRRYNPCLALDALSSGRANEPRAWIPLIIIIPESRDTI